MSSTDNIANCKYTALSIPPIVYSMENAKAVISPYHDTTTANYNFESPNPFLSKMSSPIRSTPTTPEKVAFVNMGDRGEVSRHEFLAVPYEDTHGQQLASIGSRFYAPKTAKGTLNSKSDMEKTSSSETNSSREKNNDDYIFQFYVGSLTVVGLFILFRLVQKT